MARMQRRLAALTLSLVLLLPPIAAGAADVLDIDGDGIPDAQEDANGNRIWDNDETNPLDADTDGGGEADGSETGAGRNPLRHDDDFTFDRDGDGLTNGQEATLGSNPDLRDTDGDSIPDDRDPLPLIAADGGDADRDGLPDSWELQHGLSPRNDNDAAADDDGDGVSNLQEYARKTDPHVADALTNGVWTSTSGSGQTLSPVASCIRYAPEREAEFSDTAGHWAEQYVAALARTLVKPSLAPVIQGYVRDGRSSGIPFRPDQQISRFELLKIALYTNCLEPLSSALLPTSPFSDVASPQPDDAAETALRRRIILTASFLEIIEGYPDGTFRPDAPVTRAEAAKILLLAAALPTDDALQSTFADVPDHAWFAPAVTMLSSVGIIQGYSDGLFHPEAPITRAEATKIALLLLLGNTNIDTSSFPEEVRAFVSEKATPAVDGGVA